MASPNMLNDDGAQVDTYFIGKIHLAMMTDV
jgi:hypothetical protein